MGKLKLHHRILILAGIFLVAVIAFVLFRQGASVSHDEVYSSTLEEARLPVVWVEMCGRKMNCMRGHTSEVSFDETYDSLTLLPENRNLTLYVEGGAVNVIGAKYEIRSTDLEQLVEQTDVKDMVKDETGTKLYVPIQNLIIKGKEYRLDIALTDPDGRDIHYYTRIMQTDENQLASDMIDLMQEFSSKNFNYDLAKDNTIYVETDGTADDTTLAFTNLKSTFNSLALNALKLTPSDNKDIRLCTYDGNTGEVCMSYIATRALSDGTSEEYEISETCTMRMGLTRIYMLNYSRNIREIYKGEGSVSGKRIMLGINEEDELDCITTEDDSLTYFVSTRDLWSLNTQTSAIKSIFSFRSNSSDDMVSGYRHHGIKLVDCAENGDLTFLLYGYMNRGVHEGSIGMSLMKYSVEKDTVSEVFFIPISRTFESIAKDVEEFSYLSQSDIYYAKVDGNFYAIDTKDGSYITLAQNLDTGNYAINKSMQKLAWQEENEAFGSAIINIFDMDSGKKQEIRSTDGLILKAEGFIGRDIVISMHDRQDAWKINGVVRSIPANAVQIMDENLNILKRYERESEYVGDINVHDGRVNMQLLKKTAAGTYTKSTEDTIVSSTESPERREDIGSYNDDFKERVFYIQLNDDVRRSTVKVAAHTDIEEGGALIDDITLEDDDRYFAYGDNDLLAVTDSVSSAINSAYDKMGCVRYKGAIIYNRPAMVTSRIIDGVADVTGDILTQRANGELFDLYGITLREALYYVSLKYPVLAYTDDGRAVAIYAYDKTTVSLFDLNAKEREYWNQEQAAEMFARSGGDFSCSFTLN